MRKLLPEDATLARSLRTIMDEPFLDDALHLSEGRMAAYCAHELDKAKRERVEAHLTHCARCADELVTVIAVENDALLAASFSKEVRAAAEAASTAVESLSWRRAAARRNVDWLHRQPRALRRSQPSGEMRFSMRKAFRVVATLTMAVVATVVAATAGSHVVLHKLESMLSARMSDTLGRQVSGGSASLTLGTRPGLKVDSVSIAEDPLFGGGNFATARSASVRLDTGALLQGRLQGDVHLDSPTVLLVRDSGGAWNVQNLAGVGLAAARAAVGVGVPGDPGDLAMANRVVRLEYATISDGTLEIRDETDDDYSFTLRNLYLSYASTDPTAPARITLTSQGDGDAAHVELTGTMGPFEGTSEPRWQLEAIKLERLHFAKMPSLPNVSGDVSFDGTFMSSGSRFGEVLSNASGDGALGICCGEIRKRNLASELLMALVGGEAAQNSADILAIAKQSPALGQVLSTDTTAFEDFSCAITIANGAVSFDDLNFETALFQAKATGSVSRGGALDAHGTVSLTPAATAAIVALVPQSERMFGAGGKLEVPFSLAGRWPDVDVRVDVRTAIARLMAPLDPRLLAIGPRVAG